MERVFSKIAAFKLSQFVFSASGMMVHAYYPLLRSPYDSTLIPAVFGGYALISLLFLLTYICCLQKPVSLHITSSAIAAVLYISAISALMDSFRPKDEAWTILLVKSFLCLMALASHLLEILDVYVESETQPPRRTNLSGRQTQNV